MSLALVVLSVQSFAAKSSLSPASLILLERSEPSLYAIEQELRSLLPNGVQLHSVLGSATDHRLLCRLFADQSVDLVFHAAAYKHVPLVEANPLAGLANNVFSAAQVCRASVSTGVSQVLLISTDKAVRPTNVMGATKRLAELVLQAHSAEHSSTRFAMVRFRECSWFFWICCSSLSSADFCWWAYHLTIPKSFVIS